MAQLIAAAAVFVLLHLLVSGTRLRDAITGAIGEGPYMGLFSLASIAALVWLGFVITTLTVNNAFQRRSPVLTVIDGGHWLAVLIVQGIVVGAFG